MLSNACQEASRGREKQTAATCCLYNFPSLYTRLVKKRKKHHTATKILFIALTFSALKINKTKNRTKVIQRFWIAGAEHFQAGILFDFEVFPILTHDSFQSSAFDIKTQRDPEHNLLCCSQSHEGKQLGNKS